MSTETNYFVCTLGQATLLDNGTPYRNVNHLLAHQARHQSELPALGFYRPTKDQSERWTHHVISFKDLNHMSLAAAEVLSKQLRVSNQQTVGLLSASSPAFLFTWLGLIALGHSVLLIAPQCSASATAHLCKACNASILFHDGTHEGLADRAREAARSIEFSSLTISRLPFEDDEEVFRLSTRPASTIQATIDIAGDRIAYYHHSSGTSTGIPKPIPQTHHGAVAVLPALNGSSEATFTTTPLFHGGVADSFRAWSSSAMIWLFPGQHVPITAANVVKCLEASQAAAEAGQTPRVTYFSSVPYVLQMMAQDEKGLAILQNMDIVGVGGAALPVEAGDELVSKGVNLISRYGSAECGFLMSSHRNFDNDQAWHYLRHDPAVRQLRFERQEDGLSELVVLDGWPHMAKRNREDGSFATADLLEPHPDIPHAWRYHSRADSQLTLITGKKFDPTPFEDSIAASTQNLSGVLIFGNGKPYPGALLFRSEAAKDITDADLIKGLSPVVAKLNGESQGHARIPSNMLIAMPYRPSPLEKSSKGTVLRGKAEEIYTQEIELAYDNITPDATDHVPDGQLEDAIRSQIESVIGDDQFGAPKLHAHTDLFAFGVDSIASVQIRHFMKQLLPKDAPELPMTVVQDSGTISKLCERILNIRHGRKDEKEDQRALLERLVDEHSVFDHASSQQNVAAEVQSKESGSTVLLTGPTGSLGSHILSQLLSNTAITKIYLLVRGATPHAAKERVVKALKQRKLAIPADFDAKVTIMTCKLSESQLGLSKPDLKTLRSEVDVIMHLAWSVNFLLSLKSFGQTHLAGLKNLLDLALTSKRPTPPKFLFCSSVASVSTLVGNGEQVPEHIVKNPSASGPTGYALSKLAAELICSRCAQNTQLRDRISILRIGQLSGDTQNGVWSKSEAYPLMLASSKATGVLPDLGESETLGWLPVDVAAAGYIEAAFPKSDTVSASSTDGVQVTHLLNPSTSTTFTDLLNSLKKTSGANFKVVSPDVWLARLSDLQNNNNTKDHPALKLLSFWQEAYGSNPKTNSKPTTKTPTKRPAPESIQYAYEMTQSLTLMPSVKPHIGPLADKYMGQMWRWIDENVQ